MMHKSLLPRLGALAAEMLLAATAAAADRGWYLAGSVYLSTN